ncbi:HEPN domain-containing protein [Pseudoalteromonas sp. CST5]|uniref:HEPN domain-containing protein n=1 Tax=unclassified Pseudoalteromonas TaxID=194690 RepID=UPI002359C6CF|nr:MULTISPECIES: HEPN domain-containing protein [unclassified Pseudoalteromonas]MDC9511690.1 HEPN domain-containing protein [Pseudoalteromonas sp. CST1]MDC9535926.1 HEPN domain-containing protein [Pseudoalteromonas sp. CST3]MDC9540711.1 HEPN domain-containing protein [Pseudoalteromonas sp. CST2]MDC9544888.1 HEPN domain-containing protein [Pseudoalteromonas sp. CST4]MDC9548103.1 HEPN domain-containing protein [Pseudoalteromonas sp. CST5]
MKSIEWLERGLNQNDPIDCLSNCWMGFNSLYSNSSSKTEVDSIKSFIDTNVDLKVAQELLDIHQIEITYFMTRPVIDMRGNGKSSQTDIDIFNSTDCAVSKLKSILMVIYQVRCNLMHGQKSPSRDRDVDLCKHSWPFVAELVDRYS